MAIARIRIPFDQWSVLISTSGFQTLRVYPVQPGQVVKLDLSIISRQTDEANRAEFQRMGVFFREGTNPVQHQGKTWHTMETVKSDSQIDIRYVLSGNSVIIQGRNASGVPTRWAGRVVKQVLNF